MPISPNAPPIIAALLGGLAVIVNNVLIYDETKPTFTLKFECNLSGAPLTISIDQQQQVIELNQEQFRTIQFMLNDERLQFSPSHQPGVYYYIDRKTGLLRQTVDMLQVIDKTQHSATDTLGHCDLNT